MTTTDIEIVYVCHCCICDRSLSGIVRAEGTRVECSYCGRVSKAFPLHDVAERIHEVLQARFEFTQSEPQDHERFFSKEGLWIRSGDPVEDVIIEIAGVNTEIATDMRELLSDLYRYRAVKDGEENPYDTDACYEEREVDDLDFRESWNTFREEVRFRVRFFSTYAEETLTHIFGDLDTHKAFSNRSVVREVSQDERDFHIWRGRTAQSLKELKAILTAPSCEIGPPPSRRANGRRMNVSGIPVLYGALEQDTCVAELRAPVGSHVVLGRFVLLRSIRLLDFNALMEIYVDTSHFDPDYDILHARATFLRSLVSEICRPVMPQDEAFEYLPSQVVAEYLANKLNKRLDGIIFPSSQTEDGQNVVLFNHACGVATDDLSEGTEVIVYISQRQHKDCDDGEDDDSYIQVIENDSRTCAPSPNNESASRLDILTSPPDLTENHNDDEERPMWSKPTLRLDLDSVLVSEIKSVSYGQRRHEVFRYRRLKDET